PSLELRHDAVQKVIDQAAQSLTTGNKAGATELLQQALNCSRDAKQIDEVAKKLAELGQRVNLQKVFGFLSRWKVIGPFDNTGGKGFDAVYPPELNIDLTAQYDGKTGKVRWQDYVTHDDYGKVDLNKPCGKVKEVAGYAFTDFFSQQVQSV